MTYFGVYYVSKKSWLPGNIVQIRNKKSFLIFATLSKALEDDSIAYSEPVLSDKVLRASII